VLLKRPAAQSVQVARPAIAEYFPGTHRVHLRSPPVENWPAAQFRQLADLVVAEAEYAPSTHGVQLIAPVPDWY
jgi:hypothetical protein